MADAKAPGGGVLRASGLVGAARVATMFLGLVINMALARLLPLDTLGSFFLLASLVQVAALLAMAGTTHSAVPLVAQALGGGLYAGGVRPVLRGMGVYIGIVLLAVSVIGLAQFDRVAAFAGVDGAGLLLAVLVLLWLVARTCGQAIAHGLRAMGRVGLFGLFETFLYNLLLAMALLGLLVVGGSPGLIAVTGLAAGAAVLAGLAALVPMRRETATLPERPGVSLAPVVRVSLPLWLLVAANAALVEAHLWVSGLIGSPESAALFGAAFRVARLVALPLLAVNLALGPVVARLWRQGDLAGLQALLGRSAAAVLAVSILLLAALVLGGPGLLILLFGEAFGPAWPALLILLAGQALNAATGSPLLVMTATEAQRPAMVLALVSGAAGLALSLGLAAQDPLRGVAFGAAVAVTLQNLLALGYCRWRLGLRTQPTLVALRRQEASP